LSKFQECSGLEINKSKIEGLGASRKNAAKPLGLFWLANSILAMGIKLSFRILTETNQNEKHP